MIFEIVYCCNLPDWTLSSTDLLFSSLVTWVCATLTCLHCIIWIWMTHVIISMWVSLSWWGWRLMAMLIFEIVPSCLVVRLFLPFWIGYQYFTWLAFSSTVLLFSSSVIWLSASLACLHCWFYNWMTHLFSVYLK